MQFDCLISCSIFKKSCKNDGVPQKSPKLVTTSNNSYIYFYNVRIGKSINIHNRISIDNAVSNFKQTGWNLTILSVVAFSKNHVKNMGCHKSYENLSKLPTIVIFTITMSVLVKASIFTSALALTIGLKLQTNRMRFDRLISCSISQKIMQKWWGATKVSKTCQNFQQ